MAKITRRQFLKYGAGAVLPSTFHGSSSPRAHWLLSPAARSIPLRSSSLSRHW
jgi:hypothetical protein